MKLIGKVFSRTKGVSSPNDAPSETEILKLNPQRKSLILSNTAWGDIASGTLNLSVSEESFSLLENFTVTFKENGLNVIYPEASKNIPIMRGEYRYYKANISTEKVLIRCAKKPHSRKVIEILAEHNLRNKLDLSDKDVITIEVQ